MQKPQAPRPGVHGAVSHAQASHMVHDTAHFVQNGPGPISLMKGTNTSAPLNWRSRDVNAGEGHLAGQGKTNRGTVLETGF